MGPCTFWAPVLLPRNCPVLIRMRVVSQGKRLAVAVVMFLRMGIAFLSVAGIWRGTELSPTAQGGSSPGQFSVRCQKDLGHPGKIQLSFPASFSVEPSFWTSPIRVVELHTWGAGITSAGYNLLPPQAPTILWLL